MRSNEGCFGSLDQHVLNPLSTAQIECYFSAFRRWGRKQNTDLFRAYEPIINHSSKWSLTRHLKDLLGDKTSKSTLNKLMQYCRESSVLTFFRAWVYVKFYMLTQVVFEFLYLFVFLHPIVLLRSDYSNFRSNSSRSDIDWINYPSVLQ